MSETLTDVSAAPKAQKQSLAKEKIHRYFVQLTKGCGDPYCTNDCCASSAACAWSSLSTNRAAGVAIELLQRGVRLCPPYEPAYLTEVKLSAVTASCRNEGCWQPLIAYVSGALSSLDLLVKSFPKHRGLSPVQSVHQENNGELPRSDAPLGGSNAVASSQASATAALSLCPADGGPIVDDECVDYDAARRALVATFSLEENAFHLAVAQSLVSLSHSMTRDLQDSVRVGPWVTAVLLLLEIPCLHAPEYMDQAYPAFLRAASWMPLSGQVQLVRRLSVCGAERLRALLEQLQQLITCKILIGDWSSERPINSDTAVTSAVQMMQIIYYASLLGGVCDSKQLRDAESAYANNVVQHRSVPGQRDRGRLTDQDPPALRRRHAPKTPRLENALGLRPIDCRVPLLSADEFVNKLINEKLEMDHDLVYYKSNERVNFAFLSCPFVLSTATKSLALFYDNRLRMMSERRVALMQSILFSNFSMPYLRLLVRRDHIVEDALNRLEMVYTDDPSDLRKQLYVEFEGEQGIDEGGVSKEFFQLIVEELFNPDFGMFVYNEDTRTFWFNHGSFENEAQFALVGILLGLAIYNNVVLDVRFPMVVYRKLLGKLGSFEDLADSHPVLYRSLKQLLEHDGNVEEDFVTTFAVSSRDVFGAVEVHALKENGEQLPVTNSNRAEYVALYADHLLNRLIEKQFAAFARGFQMVVEESPLQQLFLPSEIEQLVCGSTDWDFSALQEGCEYDGGYTAETPIIRHFWDVVHGMSDSEKRLLLQFTTGSDRVPVGGLAQLRLIITRHGPDTDRLPTAHTCFNVLLLPEYNSLEKLRERLLLAITHAKGFGML